MYNILFLHKVQCRMTPIHKSNLIQLSLNSSAATPQAQYFKIKKHIHMMTSRKQEINTHHNLSGSWLLKQKWRHEPSALWKLPYKEHKHEPNEGINDEFSTIQWIDFSFRLLLARTFQLLRKHRETVLFQG